MPNWDAPVETCSYHEDEVYLQKKRKEWGEVKRLSLDEISMRKGHQDFVTVVSDIDLGQLIEVINSHKQEDMIRVLKQQPLQVRARVEEVSVDLWGGATQSRAGSFSKCRVRI